MGSAAEDACSVTYTNASLFAALGAHIHVLAVRLTLPPSSSSATPSASASSPFLADVLEPRIGALERYSGDPQSFNAFFLQP